MAVGSSQSIIPMAITDLKHAKTAPAPGHKRPVESVTLADVLAELRAQRELLEQLVAQPQPRMADDR
jgi:hypothetical protein